MSLFLLKLLFSFLFQGVGAWKRNRDEDNLSSGSDSESDDGRGCSIVVNPEDLQSAVAQKRKTAEEKRVRNVYDLFMTLYCICYNLRKWWAHLKPNQITLQQAKVEAGRIAFQSRSHGGGLTNLVRCCFWLTLYCNRLEQLCWEQDDGPPASSG